MFIPEAFPDRRFPLGIVEMDPQDEMGLHHHGYVELVLVRRGRATHLAGDRQLPLAAGEVFVIPPAFPHGYAECDDLHLINVCFEPTGLGLPLSRLQRLPGYQALFALEPRLRAERGFAGQLQLDAEQLDRLWQRAVALQGELRQREPGYQLQATALLQQLLIALSRIYQDQRGGDAGELLRLAALLARIDRHLAEPLDVERIAAWADVSSPTLQRWFRASLGCPVGAHVTRLRLERARELLLGTDLPIAAVGEQVGVTDPNYFARLFRHHHGAAPGAWRREHRSEIRTT